MNQFKELLFGAMGDFARNGLERAGYIVRNRYEAYVNSQPVKLRADQHPYLLGVTREEAHQHEGTLVNLIFAYTLARFFFTPIEQELLAQAQNGLSDEEIALRLAISHDAVKKRWATLYSRVAEQTPALLPQTDGPTRGMEKRRTLLHYLVEHPEELRFITPRKSRQGAGSIL